MRRNYCATDVVGYYDAMDARRNLHDADHLRVLAHPTRLRLLSLLRELGPQTAAGLADHVDEAPGTLSYHLTKLAGADFIEQDSRPGSDRRERWWRACQAQTVWDDADFASNPEKFKVAKDFHRILGQHYARQYEAYVESMPQLDREWVEGAVNSNRRLQITVEQMLELHNDFHALEEKWARISAEHSSGSGAEEVFLLLQAYRSAT